MNNKVVIIGCGNVGMSYAYALLNQSTNVQELVLIDLNTKRVEGEVMDLNHCLAFVPTGMKIKLGEYSDCKDASIVMIAAGANQNPGETRMDLIHKNASIFKTIVNDVMNSGFNGSGTCLDTARLRYILGEKLEINPKDINAFVMGEHGDSEFVLWSNANVGLKNIKEFLSEDILNKIEDDVKNAAYEIIDKKGATYYGIGVSLVKITNAILNDENSILTISSYDEENEVFVGGPTIINKDGAKERLFVKLNEVETTKMSNSIKIIKDAINSLE